MNATVDQNRPAIRVSGSDELGNSSPTVHVLDLEAARVLSAELQAVIALCEGAQPVPNRTPPVHEFTKAHAVAYVAVVEHSAKQNAEIRRLRSIIARNAMQRLDDSRIHILPEDIEASIKILHEEDKRATASKVAAQASESNDGWLDEMHVIEPGQYVVKDEDSGSLFDAEVRSPCAGVVQARVEGFAYDAYHSPVCLGLRGLTLWKKVG